MGKLVISINMSLDGVVEDPDGQEGFRYGGWFRDSEDLDLWAGLLFEEALGAEALLLGRRSDEWFASRWLARTGEWADRLNALPKYVVSSTLEAPRWSNATLLRGIDDVVALKRELAGDIVVYGSCELARALLAHELVDELRLFVFPVVLGAGKRLFGATRTPLRLLSSRSVGAGLSYHTYAVAG